MFALDVPLNRALLMITSTHITFDNHILNNIKGMICEGELIKIMPQLCFYSAGNVAAVMKKFSPN